MMDVHMMQYNYQSGFLVVINESYYVSVYKKGKYKFDQPFLNHQPQNDFIGKSKICAMTEFSEAYDNPAFDGDTFLLECEGREYI